MGAPPCGGSDVARRGVPRASRRCASVHDRGFPHSDSTVRIGPLDVADHVATTDSSDAVPAILAAPTECLLADGVPNITPPNERHEGQSRGSANRMTAFFNMGFDHIGIVAPSLAEGRAHIGRLLNITRWTGEFADPINQVYVQFGCDQSSVCYEIVAPLGDASPVRAALKSSNRILNHVAYRVADLDVRAAHFRENRCVAAGPPRPAIAYGNRRIQFFMTPLGFLVELIEAPEHQHLFGTIEPEFSPG
jgi:methylmalonyl-CoA/ethylmalonyl-CoA epimerase